MSGELSEYNSLKEPSEGTHSLREGEIVPFVRMEDRKPAKSRIGTQLQIPVEIVDSIAEPAGFAAFWHQYPKKVGRFEAAEAFREATKHADIEEIIAGAQRFAETRRAQESDPIKRAQYAPDPKNWLRGRRWRDDHAKPRPAGVGKHFAAALKVLGGDLG